MSDLAEMQQLLKATAELLTAGGKAEKRKAIVKLERGIVTDVPVWHDARRGLC